MLTASAISMSIRRASSRGRRENGSRAHSSSAAREPFQRTAWTSRSGASRPLPDDCSVEREDARSEEHTSELQSLAYLVCRLLLEKKKNTRRTCTNLQPCPDIRPIID